MTTKARTKSEKEVEELGQSSRESRKISKRGETYELRCPGCCRALKKANEHCCTHCNMSFHDPDCISFL